MTEETEMIPEGMPEIEEIKVLVSKDELTALLAQNAELKADIIALVNVFGMFAGLLNGKGGITSIIKVIPKLMADKGKMDSIAHIIPIIEKYTDKPAEITDGKES